MGRRERDSGRSLRKGDGLTPTATFAALVNAGFRLIKCGRMSPRSPCARAEIVRFEFPGVRFGCDCAGKYTLASKLTHTDAGGKHG
jgi:hypothetical protein